MPCFTLHSLTAHFPHRRESHLQNWVWPRPRGRAGLDEGPRLLDGAEEESSSHTPSAGPRLSRPRTNARTRLVLARAPPVWRGAPSYVHSHCSFSFSFSLSLSPKPSGARVCVVQYGVVQCGLTWRLVQFCMRMCIYVLW
jgi:hypothetical protein